MKQLVLMSRRSGSTNWGIRNRLSDENYRYRDGKITAEELAEAALKKANLWSQSEPDTDFKYEVIDEAEPDIRTRFLPTSATALGDPIAQLPGRNGKSEFGHAGFPGNAPQADRSKIPANGSRPRSGRRGQGSNGRAVNDPLDNSPND